MTGAAGSSTGPLDEEAANELASLLGGLGLDDKEAHVVAFLAQKGEGRSREIEQSCGLRQPQVSQATTSLRERGWVSAYREKTPGKGRPVNVYELDVSLPDIVEEVTARRREELNRELARIDRARSIADEVAPELGQPGGEEPKRAEHDPAQGQG